MILLPGKILSDRFHGIKGPGSRPLLVGNSICFLKVSLRRKNTKMMGSFFRDGSSAGRIILF